MKPGRQFIDLYHRTSREAAEQIRKSGSMVSKENDGSVYFSTTPDGEGEGYGDSVVHVRVPKNVAQLDDEFPSGEQHYRVNRKHIGPEQIQP